MKITKKHLRRLIKESADIIATGLYDNAITDSTKKVIKILGGLENILKNEEVANQAASFVAAFPESFQINRAYFENLKKMENLKMEKDLNNPKGPDINTAIQKMNDYFEETLNNNPSFTEDDIFAHGYGSYFQSEIDKAVEARRDIIKNTYRKRINNIQIIIDAMV